MRTADQIPQRQHNEDRMRRAKSWLKRSEAATNEGEKFIFLWIAFNAAYGSNASDPDNPGEQRKFSNFLERVLKRDERNEIEEILWGTYSGSIRILLETKYVFEPFWEYVRSERGSEWLEIFEQDISDARKRMGERDTHGVLKIVFRRLYTLRNQIFHGSATYSKGWGKRYQVHDGYMIMASLVPTVLKIMEADMKRNPDTDIWGTVAYPRIDYQPGWR